MYNKNIYIFLNFIYLLYTNNIKNIFYKIIMKIIANLCFLLLAFFVIWWVFAQDAYEEEIIQYKINSIRYDGELKDGVEVKISWENLKDCDYISHENVKLDIEDPKFVYNNSKLYWIVSINCDWVNSNYEYSFPFIESTKIVQEDNFYYLEILWKNFDKDSKVDIESLDFEKIYNSQTKIYWKLIWEVKNLELYVTSKDNQSNNVILNFTYPYIDKVESKSNFLAGSDIYISWKNLQNFDFYVDDKKTSDFIIDAKWNIVYTLDEKINDISIQFKKNNIESNTIDLELQGEVPYLKNYFEKSNNDSSTRRNLEIYGENFPFHDEDIKVYLNGEEQKISNVSLDTITLTDFEFEDGDNYIYADVNELQSNTLYHFVETKLPYPASISDISFDESKRILTVSTVDFNEETDKFYIDNSAVSILSCYSNVCRIAIDKSKLTGTITIKRWNLQHKNFIDFDYSSGQHPHVEKIVFQEDPVGLTKFTIYWNNFIGSNVSGTNIFSSDDSKPNIDITNNTIKWRLPRDYTPTQSSINVTKYSMKSSLSFSYDEIKYKTVKNAAHIDEIKPENNSFLQSWKTVFLRWYWFHKSDLLYIWDTSYSLDFSEWIDYPQIVLDPKIQTGFYEIYIESENKKVSNKIKKYISNNDSPEISFTQQENKTSEYFYNQTSSNPIFSMKIDNGIEDLYISQLEFFVDWKENVKDFWEVELHINNQKVSHSFVQEDGKIIFLEEILLKKSNDSIIIELIKSWKFYAQWTFRISYLWHKTQTKNSNQQVFINKKVLNSQYFSVWRKQIKNCFNSKSTNINCEDLSDKQTEDIKQNDIESNEKIDKATNQNETSDDKNTSWKDNSVVIKTKNQLKIDALIDNLYERKTKNSTHAWLIYFKNLNIKLSRLIADVPDNHKDKQILLYLQESVNNTYKKVFKKFVQENMNK